MKEIERKFLVEGEFKSFAYQVVPIVQGYLSSLPERTVRVRLYGEKAYLTIKGKSDAKGVSRFEWEKEILPAEARELLKICEPGVIDKSRYLVRAGDHLYEVDEFHGDNEGLILAEIELLSEDEVFIKPEWLGKEVTGNPCYYNSFLVKSPFVKWKDQ